MTVPPDLAAKACALRWDDLAPTSNPRERLCTTCGQLVVQFGSVDAVRRRQGHGGCAALGKLYVGGEGAAAYGVAAPTVAWQLTFSIIAPSPEEFARVCALAAEVELDRPRFEWIATPDDLARAPLASSHALFFTASAEQLSNWPEFERVAAERSVLLEPADGEFGRFA
jgi:hypothetical protein